MGTDGKIYIAVIIIFVFITYANSLAHSFVWDDFLVIVKNDFVKSWQNLARLFNKTYLTGYNDIGFLGVRDIGSGETSYRPTVTLSYFLDYASGKLNPFGYHLHNILLHLAASIIIYLLFFIILNNRQGALLGALLFAVHPVNSEAVNVVSFREDLLAGFFCVWAMFVHCTLNKYADERRKRRLFFSMALFFLALLSKESAIIFPFLIIAYDYYFGQKEGETEAVQTESRPDAHPESGKGNGAVLRLRTYMNRFAFKKAYGAYLAVLFGYLFIRFFLFANTSLPRIDYSGGSFYAGMSLMAKVVFTYLEWLLYPPSVHPTLPDDNSMIRTGALSDFRMITGLGCVLLFILALIHLRKKEKIISFSIFWFLIALLPVANIWPLTNYMASRYLYIPIIGVCLFFAFLTRENLRLSKDVPRRIITCLFCLFLIFCCLTTIRKNLLWKNNLVFWQGMAESYPENPEAFSALGDVYKELKLLDEAVIAYLKALELAPDYVMDYNKLGLCYFQKNDLDKAEMVFRKALQVNKSLPDIYNNLGSVLGSQARYAESIACLKQGIKVDRGNIKLYNNLGVSYAKIGQFGKAKKIWEKGLSIDPASEDIKANLARLRKK